VARDGRVRPGLARDALAAQLEEGERHQQGHWSAFWLESRDEGFVDGSGRDGTEIDIVERAWLVDQVQHTLHWDGYAAAHRSAEQLVTGRGLSDGGWHVFRVDWYPDEYVFFVEHHETWRTAAGGVCQQPNWILLTDEIGNLGTGPGALGRRAHRERDAAGRVPHRLRPGLALRPGVLARIIHEAERWVRVSLQKRPRSFRT
jgi:hypothetical protein